MKFRKYSEIENAYKDFKDQIFLAGFADSCYEYGCFRKIDGSNVQLSISENEEFIIGSRNQICTSQFSGLDRVLKRDTLEQKLREMKASLRDIEDEEMTEFLSSCDGFEMTVFGELFGGLYRHQDVPRVIEATRIQGRIDYSPDNHWMPFDMTLRNPESEQMLVVNLDTLKKLCEMHGLLCQIEEFRGTLQECLNFNVEFNDDTGHRLFGLPIIEKNTAEGVVIKPICALWLRNGQRVILKNKNPMYKERIRATKAKTLELGNSLNKNELKYLSILKEYMNESRVMSAISKIGKLTKDSFGELLKMSSLDAISEFRKDYHDELTKLENSLDPKEFDFKKITKMMNKYSSSIVREVYLKEIQ